MNPKESDNHERTWWWWIHWTRCSTYRGRTMLRTSLMDLNTWHIWFCFVRTWWRQRDMEMWSAFCCSLLCGRHGWCKRPKMECLGKIPHLRRKAAAWVAKRYSYLLKRCLLCIRDSFGVYKHRATRRGDDVGVTDDVSHSWWSTSTWGSALKQLSYRAYKNVLTTHPLYTNEMNNIICLPVQREVVIEK